MPEVAIKYIERKNCDHDWRYDNSHDNRARRICAVCRKKEVSGHTQKDEWFDSYFAVLLKSDLRLTEEILIAKWSKEEIKLPI